MQVVNEVIRGIEWIPTYANTYLLTEQRLILVDTSSEATAEKVFAHLAKAKVRPTDLTSIVVTHTHGDHASGLAAIKAKAPGAKVVAHEVEAPFITQERQYPGPPRPATHKGVQVDVRLKDGDAFEGFRALHAPGHTPGSLALYDPGRKLLVAGDALRTENGIQPMEDTYNWDPRQVRATMKRLAALDVETILCGHGAPIPRGAGAHLKAAVRGF